jgi:hypothetical protein
MHSSPRDSIWSTPISSAGIVDHPVAQTGEEAALSRREADALPQLNPAFGAVDFKRTHHRESLSQSAQIPSGSEYNLPPEM